MIFRKINFWLDRLFGRKFTPSRHLNRLALLESICGHVPETLFLEWALANEFSLGYKPFFVQIGANDGKRFDPLFIVRQRFELPGVFIEPHPEAFEQLKANFGSNDLLQFENCAVAVGEDTQKRSLFALKSSDPSHSVISSFDVNHLSNLKAKYFANLEIIEHLVEQKSLRWMIQKYQTFGDLIVICDIEGYDCELLADFPFDTCKPRLFFYEHSWSTVPMQKKLETRLLEHGYKLFQSIKDTLAYRIDSF
jgi:FkbM family methyltransferase